MVHQNRAAAIELLKSCIGSIPHPKYGTINMLPFAHDSEQTREIRHDVCEGVIDVLMNAGLIKDDGAQQVPVMRTLETRCAECGGLLVSVSVLDDGTAKVNAENYIQVVGHLNPDCQSGHRELTPDDMRAHMEREFYNDPATRLAIDCHICKAIGGQMCFNVKGHKKINGMHEERGRKQS